MKILTITNYYPPYFIGGYEIACKDTTEYLKSKGHEVEVLTSDYLLKKDNENSEKNISRDFNLINYNQISRVQKKYLEHKNYLLLKEKIQDFQPDIVYFWSLRGIGIKMIHAVEELNIAKAFEIGDFWMYGYMQPSFAKKIKSFIPFLAENTPEISPAICVSHWVGAEMKNVYGSKTTYMHPNATFIPKVILRNTKDIRFIFSGRIEEEKGLDLAIEALNQFSKKYPQAKFSFDIYGDGDISYIEKCKRLAKPIEYMINFKGKVKSKREIYTNASILLMPTRMREPFGLVIIEAMAYKCAVIATNAYGPAEIIQHNDTGLLFDHNQENDLFSQIEKLYFDKNFLYRMQDKAYEHVSQNYSIVDVKPKVEKLLENIAGIAS